MWSYTETVLDHFRNPRNVGEVENPDGAGEVGSMACGDALKLTFRLDDEGRIAEAKFKTFGCASAIASSSALTEIIQGMTIEQAAQVTNRDIAEFLGGLPEQKMHCSVMGREALEIAIDNYRTGKTGKEMLEGNVVCKCFGVTEEEIRKVVRENNLTTREQVTDYCKAGGGCERCHPDIEAIIEESRAQPAAAAPAADDFTGMTTVKKIHLIESVIEREIRPQLKKDGGDIELVDLNGGRVIVALRGRCAGCNVADFTLRDVVEEKLHEFVSPTLQVEEQK
jgi:NifU-like protein